MRLFNKKIKMYAPVDGKSELLENVDDEVFSTGMMGKGYAVIPSADEVYSPVDGVVTTLFPTKHAIGFKTGNMEILLHMGIDTVDLKGAPFTIHVKNGQKVDANTLVATMDRKAITESGRATTTLVLITNSSETVKKLDVNAEPTVIHSQEIATITPA